MKQEELHNRIIEMSKNNKKMLANLSHHIHKVRN